MGKFTREAKPGINIVLPFVQSIVVVDTRITTIDIPKQEVMIRDNVPVYINAVVYFKVEDPKLAVMSITDYHYAVSQYAQTALRDVIGNVELDHFLVNREKIAKSIKNIVDAETANWGIDIASIKIQDIELQKNMKRSMARQSEAEREKRELIIKSSGEKEAAKNLAEASSILANTPGGLHLRTLNTLTDISTDPSNKIIILLPVEVLDAFRSFSNDPSQVIKFLSEGQSTKKKEMRKRKYYIFFKL